MKNRIRALLVALLLIAAGYVAGTYKAPTVHAQQQTRAIPKAWGSCKGSTATNLLIFEGSDGTIRLVNFDGKLLLQIGRQ